MSEMNITKNLLPGVFLLECPRYTDHRGDFTKLYHTDALSSVGLIFNPAESFLTRSKKDVIRGMHFQVNEAAHDKLVHCPKGPVLDVVVDVRQESAQFNMPVAIELCETDTNILFIGKGYAHGFLSLEDDSWMIYATTSIHNPALDRGVLWSSINFDWPIDKPIVSERDAQHPLIKELKCTF